MDDAPAVVRCQGLGSLAILPLVARLREQSAAQQLAAVYREPSAAQPRAAGSHEQLVAQQRARACTDLQQVHVRGHRGCPGWEAGFHDQEDCDFPAHVRVRYRLREDCGHRLGVPDADLLPDCRLHRDDR
jgi:hypothetical protein